MALEPIRWLHLSDLHLGCRGETAWWQTHDVFRRQLGEWVERVGPPDLVLFTGDLTNRAKAEEFAALDAFLAELYATLELAGAKTRPLLLPVPGNHDLVRPSGKAMRQFEWIQPVLATPAKFDEYAGEEAPTEILAAFEPYQVWFDRSVRPALRAHRLHCSAFPGDYSIRIELPNRPPLLVVGMNSAWAHYRDVEAGGLALLARQFQNALPREGTASPLQLFRDDPLALLLMHHPPAWLSPSQRTQFLRDVAAADRFAAALFGHMHEARSESSSFDAGAHRVWYQSPSLFGAEHYGERKVRLSSGFTFGELYESGELRIWPLRLVDQGGGQAFSLDSHFTPTRSKGVEFVRLREGRKPKGRAVSGRTMVRRSRSRRRLASLTT